MWPTPTPRPAPVSTPIISIPDLQAALPDDLVATVAEGSVSGWNTVNEYGLMDNIMTLVLLIIVLLMLSRVIQAFRDI